MMPSGGAEAGRRNLTVTGTLGVLRTAGERGLIDVPVVIARLRATWLGSRHGFASSIPVARLAGPSQLLRTHARSTADASVDRPRRNVLTMNRPGCPFWRARVMIGRAMPKC